MGELIRSVQLSLALWRRTEIDERRMVILHPAMLRIIAKIEMGGTCNTHGRIRNWHNILVSKCQGNRPLARSRRRWG
jgi:hypothetical protein